MKIVAAIPRLIACLLFLAAGTAGIDFTSTCTFRWTILGATLLMYAWSLHWALRLAAIFGIYESMRTSQLVQAAGYLAAAICFAVAAVREGVWTAIVAVLFLAASVMYAFDH